MIQESLRTHIEGVVRPISANFARKDQMREELLAGLTDLYEAEIAEGCDTQEALRRAIEQFGDPDEIRREMQATVPLRERILYCGLSCPKWVAGHGWLRRLGRAVANAHLRGPGEPVVRHALRLTAGAGIFLLACLVPLLAITLAMRFIKHDSMHRFIVASTVAGGALVASLLACFLFALIGHGIQNALEDRFWGRKRCCRVVPGIRDSILCLSMRDCVVLYSFRGTLPYSLPAFPRVRSVDTQRTALPRDGGGNLLRLSFRGSSLSA